MKKVFAAVLVAALVLTAMVIPSFALEHNNGDTTEVAINTTDFALSFDTFYLDGVSHMEMGWGDDGGANAKLTANKVTGSHENLTVRGWMGLKNADIVSVGYKLNGGEPVFDEGFKREAEGPVINAGGEMRMEVLVPLNAGTDPQLITIVAKGDDDVVYEAIEFSINGQYGESAPVDPNAKTFNNVAIVDNGGGAIGTWINANKDTAYVEFTTAGAFKGIALGIYWASNPAGTGPKADWTCELYKFAYNVENTLAQAPVKSTSVTSDADNNPVFSFDLGEEMAAGTYIVKFTITNPEYTEEIGGETKSPYLVLPKIDNPDETKFKYFNDPFNIVLVAENVEGGLFAANPEDTDVPSQPDTQPETQPQTGDAAVAMIAVIAVLAMSAAVVFARKKSY